MIAARVWLHLVSCHVLGGPTVPMLHLLKLVGLLMYLPEKTQLGSNPPEVPRYPQVGRPFPKTPTNPDLRLKNPQKAVLVGLIGAQLRSVESSDGPMVIVKLLGFDSPLSAYSVLIPSCQIFQ
jgi:hypothetical protein